MTKDCELKLRLTANDREAIAAKANALGLSMSAFIRQSALSDNVADVQSLRADLLALRREITKTGSSVHQVARGMGGADDVLEAYRAAVEAVAARLRGLPR